MRNHTKWALIVLGSVVVTILAVYVVARYTNSFGNYMFTPFLIAIGGLSAIFQNTWVSSNKGFMKLKTMGLVTLCVIIAGFQFSVLKNYEKAKELEQLRIRNLHNISELVIHSLVPFRFISEEVREYPEEVVGPYLLDSVVKEISEKCVLTNTVPSLEKPEDVFNINYNKLKRGDYYKDKKIYNVMIDAARELYEKVFDISNYRSEEVDAEVLALLHEAVESNYISILKDTVPSDFADDKSPNSLFSGDDYLQYVKIVEKLDNIVHFSMRLNSGGF